MQTTVYLLAVLAVLAIAALAGLFRQRALRKRIAAQAAELTAQRALLRTVYDHIPTAMALVEFAADGPRLLWLNREAGTLYGIDPERAANQAIANLALPTNEREHLLEVLRRANSASASAREEYRIEGSKRVLEVVTVPVDPGPDGLPRLCVLSEDVSGRKLLDAEVAQSRRLRAVGELVGGIAHEFNNLLTPMMLKIGEVQMDWASDAKLQQEIELISQATQRAAELTRRLLTFGRKSDTRADAVMLSELVANCFDLVRPAMDRRIAWESDIPEDLDPLYLNATELNQVLINLLLNARDTLIEKLDLPHDDDWSPRILVTAAALPPSAATPGKPKARLPLLGWQRLSVNDNGLGMPAHVLERLFEPFFTTKQVGKGTGLGLATVWHIVTEAGGKVEAESKPGSGTTFHVYLPVWPAIDAPDQGADRTRAGAPAAANVLVIEDDLLVAETMTAILKRNRCNIRHVADGAEAWRHLSDNLNLYNLLVIDVNLPGLTGVELVSRLRESSFPGRILVVSGRIGLFDLKSLVRLRVDRVLTKPFTVAQFEAALRECLG